MKDRQKSTYWSNEMQDDSERDHNESTGNEAPETCWSPCKEEKMNQEIKSSNRSHEVSAASCSDTDMKNDTASVKLTSEDTYASRVTYNEQGEAIYTDPEHNCQYKWSEEKNEWIKYESGQSFETNPYENEHYKWCSETNQWIPKFVVNSDELNKEACVEGIEQSAAKSETVKVDYNSETSLHTYTDKDGMVFFWDVERNAWFPKIDDDFMARYQMSYGFTDNTSKSNEGDQLKTSQNSKPELETSNNLPQKASQSAKGTRKMQPDAKQWFDLPPERNTKVYVNNLPLDITEEEFAELMSKCGLLMRDPKTQKYKIKLYSEPNGQLKGDGLCDYIKVESVSLALNLLDGYEIRGKKISVQRASFQMRGEYNPALKPKMRKKDKEKIAKMKERLFDWRPEKMRGQRSRHERVVIIKNLFTPECFDNQVQLVMEYQDELRAECAKYGTVKKVVLYDRHPEGIAQVTMSDPDEASMVVQLLNGRIFNKRTLQAEIWDGKTKYKTAETAEETDSRLKNWGEFLELGDKNDLNTPADDSESKLPSETLETSET